jgi:hypothetical protein
MNRKFFTTEFGTIINLDYIVSIEPCSAANNKSEMLKMGLTEDEINRINNINPYGVQTFTSIDNYCRFKNADTLAIGYYKIRLLGVNGGGMSTYGVTYNITGNDYNEIMRILDN